MTRPLKIFLSVGTHEQPFQRLLDMGLHVQQATDHTLVAQYGVGQWQGTADIDAPLTSSQYFSPSEMRALLSWCDLFVSQASPGNLFGALHAGRWPLLLGRRTNFGEHVDDHQVEFAMHASSLDLCTNIEDWGTVSDAIGALMESSSVEQLCQQALTSAAKSDQRATAFRHSFWSHIQTD